MAPFTAPDPYYQGTKNKLWRKTAPSGMCATEDLWELYWDRFNTFQIPIFSEDEYFDTAISIAKAAKDKQEFERMFEKINKQRHEMLLKTLSNALRECVWHDELFPCKDAKYTAHSVCVTGCLDHFVRLLKGNVFGWEADTAEADEENEEQLPNNAGNNRSEDKQNPDEEEPKNHVKETQNASEGEKKDAKNPTEEDVQNPAEEDIKDHVEESQSLAPEETQTPVAKVTKEAVEDPPYPFNMDDYDYSTQQIPPDWETQMPDIDWGYDMVQKRKADKLKEDKWKEGLIFTGTYAEYIASKSNGAARETLDSDNNELPSARQLLALEPGEPSISDKEVQNSDPQDTPTKHSSDASDGKSSTLTKKRVRFNDDDDDDAIHHEPKRQKVENSATPTPTSEPSPSIQKASCASATRKRSRPDDDNDEDNGFKRQKIESLPSPPTSHISSIESAEDTPANNPPSKLPIKTSETPDKNAVINGERKRRNRARPLRNPSNSRSSRRGKSSTLWELDSSGKPHSVS